MSTAGGARTIKSPLTDNDLPMLDTLPRLLSTSLLSLRDWIFPERCRLCAAPGAALCADCCVELPRLSATRCPICARPQAGNSPCGACQGRAPGFAAVYTPFAYAAPLDGAIQAWKFGGRLDWTLPLADVWLNAWEELPPFPHALVPVPLHRSRLRERGFNQAALLARRWGRAWGIPVRLAARRQRDTAHQVGLKAEQRRHNLRDAFRIHGSLPEHVAIVDDVFTTGTTAGVLAETLRAAGCRQVDVWVLARAL